MAKQSITAIILIAVGSLLFLEQIDILYLSARDYYIYGAIIGGILWLINGVNRDDKKGVLAGSFFFSFGIVLWLMRNYYFVRSDEFGIASFFLCLALANFVYYIFKRNSTNNVIFGVIFGVLGGGFLLSHLDYYPLWRFFDHIEQYWPVAIIVFGIAILYKGLRKKEAIRAEQH
jgi:cell wall-active antibiotic response 4TMS protein YvqF